MRVRLPTVPATCAAACVCAFAFLCVGCQSVETASLPKAYVAPGTLNLRRELTKKDSVVTVLHHDDSVYVVDTRRRFVKIRTQQGMEGWVDAAQLMTADQHGEMERARDVALRMPSEGAAGVFEPLNVHIEPNRASPAFTRILEGGSVEVLQHKLQPKLSGPLKAPQFVVERPVPSRKPRRAKKEVSAAIPLPPLLPPKPPPEAEDFTPSLAQEKAADAAVAGDKPVLYEDWTLIRTKAREVGWVLTRNLVMSIPDEVAQYAEGRRITSYFSLGDIQDEEKGLKHHWLWTTASQQEQFDFDAWRVFIWNRRRHRYETSYREREVEGYFPVHVDAPDGTGPQRTFALLMKEDDGKLYQRSYGFDGVRVHLLRREPADATKALEEQAEAQRGTRNTKAVAGSWWTRLLQRFKRK